MGIIVYINYFNYLVLQKALEYAKNNYYTLLISLITPQMEKLKSKDFGAKIYFTLIKTYPELNECVKYKNKNCINNKFQNSNIEKIPNMNMNYNKYPNNFYNGKSGNFEQNFCNNNINNLNLNFQNQMQNVPMVKNIFYNSYNNYNNIYVQQNINSELMNYNHIGNNVNRMLFKK